MRLTTFSGPLRNENGIEWFLKHKNVLGIISH